MFYGCGTRLLKGQELNKILKIVCVCVEWVIYHTKVLLDVDHRSTDPS